jgi:hypothetical protein
MQRFGIRGGGLVNGNLIQIVLKEGAFQAVSVGGTLRPTTRYGEK